MNDYQTLRKILLAEQRRREAYYRFRPTERGPAMAEIGEGLAALDRMKRAGDWAGVARHWTDRFDE